MCSAMVATWYFFLVIITSCFVDTEGIFCGFSSTCQTCTTKRSWWFGKHCEWCSTSKSCHTPRSFFRRCNQSQVIKDSGKCYDSIPGVYNPTSAFTSTLLAAAAYSDSPGTCLKKIYPENDIEIVEKIAWTCTDLKFFRYKRCFAYTAVSRASKIIIVAFRGTIIRVQLIDEILSVLTIPKERFVIGGKVQNYFKNAYDGLYPCVNESIKVLVQKYPDYQVVVIGHSLGGAIASLTAAALVHYKVVPRTKMTLYTFGQPRVGDTEYADNHDKLVSYSWRVVHYRDIVSHLPTCNILFGCSAFKYTPHHHGIEIFYPSVEMNVRSKYKQCSKDEDIHCSDGLVTKHACISDIRQCISYHKHYFGMEVGAVCKRSSSLYYNKVKSSNIWKYAAIEKCRRFKA